MTEQTQAQGDTLYYDGSCPICRREVDHLKRTADERLQYVNIHETTMNATERQRFSQQLHLETEQGLWLTGLEANVQAWQHTRLARPARLLLSRPVRPLAAFAYRLWLRFYHWQRRRRAARSQR